jgi:hypothetical protein
MEPEGGGFQGVAGILSRFAVTISGELRNPQQLLGESVPDKQVHWMVLRGTWQAEVAALRKALGGASSSKVDEGSSSGTTGAEEGST